MLRFTCASTLDFGHVPVGRQKFMKLTFTVYDDGTGNNGTEPFYIEIQRQTNDPAPAAFRFEPHFGWTLVSGKLRSAEMNLAELLTTTFEVFLSFWTPSEVPTSYDGYIQLRVHAHSGGNPVPKSVELKATLASATTIQLALVLDRSESMAFTPAGSTKSRSLRMREALAANLPLLQNPDQVAVVSFNETATPVISLGPMGQQLPPSNKTRRTLIEELLAPSNPTLDPHLETSIGSGVIAGRNLLDSSLPKNVLVLTDGLEDFEPLLSQIGSAGETRYAIGVCAGLSSSENPLGCLAATKALTRIAGYGRYLYWTGDYAGDDAFRLEKYFSQTLLEITDTSVVLDPNALIVRDDEHIFEVDVTEADHSFEFFVLSESSPALRSSIRPAEGKSSERKDEHPTLDASPRVERIPETDYRDQPQRSSEDSQDRFFEKPKPPPPPCDDDNDEALPMETREGNRSHLHRVLSLPPTDRRPAKLSFHLRARDLKPGTSARYTLLVAAKSDLKLDAALHADGVFVGARLLLSAFVTQFGERLRENVRVYAEVLFPDGDRELHPLKEESPGRFALRLETLRPGIYEVRFIAVGRSLFRRHFRRELLRSIAILPETDRLLALQLAEPHAQPPRWR